MGRPSRGAGLSPCICIAGGRTGCGRGGGGVRAWMLGQVLCPGILAPCGLGPRFLICTMGLMSVPALEGRSGSDRDVVVSGLAHRGARCFLVWGSKVAEALVFGSLASLRILLNNIVLLTSNNRHHRTALVWSVTPSSSTPVEGFVTIPTWHSAGKSLAHLPGSTEVPSLPRNPGSLVLMPGAPRSA